ncbi:MAG: NosD domain-containing protein [Promethearchaeota archaeon]
MSQKKRIIILFLSFLVFINIFTYSFQFINNSDKNKNPNHKECFQKPKSSIAKVWEYDIGTGGNPFVDISSDGKYFVVGVEETNNFYLFNSSSKSLLWSYSLPSSSEITDIAISSDGYYIAVGGGSNGFLYLFDRTSSTPIWESDSSLGTTCKYVSISSDGQYISAVGDPLSTADIYLFTRTSSGYIWRNTTINAMSAVMASDSNYIAVGEGPSFHLFQRSGSSVNWEGFYSGGGVIPDLIEISSDGYHMAEGGNSKIAFYNRSSYSPMWDYSIASDFNDFAMSSNGDYLVVGSNDKGVYLFNKSYSSSKTPMWNKSTGGYVSSVAISGNGNYIAAGSSDHNVYFINRTSPSQMDYCLITDVISDIAMSDDGHFIVAGSVDGYIHFFHSLPPDPFILDSDAGDPIDDDGEFNLNWDPSPGAIEYYVYTHDSYFTDVNQGATKISSKIYGNSYPISGLSSGDYYYAVLAVNEAGNTTSNCISVRVLAPPGPFDLYSDATNPDDDGEFTLFWDESSSARNYTIYVDDDYISSIYVGIDIVDDGIENNSYTISGLNNGEYYYVVVAYNEIDSQISNNLRITVKLRTYWDLSGSPIYIDDSNPNYKWSEISSDNIWCKGMGTSTNPYIIENTILNGQELGNCIEIKNSNVFFIIRNCTLFNSSSSPLNAGIKLSNTKNGIIDDNNCSYNQNIGILLDNNSNDNTISNNIINHNDKNGIALFNNCQHNNVSHNIGLFNEIGLHLRNNSNFNTISGNTMNNNNISGITMYNCYNNSIINNQETISYNGLYGIFLQYSDENEISNNRIEFNPIGIYLDESNDNQIINNEFIGNENNYEENNCVGNVFRSDRKPGFLMELLFIVIPIISVLVIGAGLILYKKNIIFKKEPQDREQELERLREKVKKPKTLFLSYKTTDSEFFNIPEISKRLEAYPEIDKVLYWETYSKENIVEYMEKALNISDVFILFCTKSSLESDAVRDEWQAAFQRRKKGLLKFIPVYEIEEDIPSILGHLLNVKFDKKNFDKFIEDLFREIIR